jgi:hypothetical protein
VKSEQVKWKEEYGSEEGERDRAMDKERERVSIGLK